jgi:16S rRNA (uracil1498-N3)-methyltransferase
MTTAFYAPPDAFRGSRVVLPDDEARHAATVLRASPGDEIVVVDGVGGWHTVRLDHATKRQAVGTVVDTRRNVGEPAVDVTVGLGLVKNRNRFETFVEKAVEMGVGRIVPMHTARTEKESVRETRLRNLLVAALKQCGRSRLPALDAPTPLDAVLDASNPADDDTLRLICHEAVHADASLTSMLTGALASADRPKRVTVLVGPEGGFTDAEVDAATDAGFVPVSLGPRRLRAETAALLATGAVTLWCDAG